MNENRKTMQYAGKSRGQLGEVLWRWRQMQGQEGGHSAFMSFMGETDGDVQQDLWSPGLICTAFHKEAKRGTSKMVQQKLENIQYKVLVDHENIK